MTDNELRGLLLHWYYEKRREGDARPNPEDFERRVDDQDITRISRQLYEHGLIRAAFVKDRDAGPYGSLHHARITADGIDVVEGTAQAPISISIHNRTVEDQRTFNISHSSGFQVGDYNNQEVLLVLEHLVEHVDQADASEQEKTEAKSYLAKFLKHPLVVETFGEGLSRLPQAASLASLLGNT